MNDKRTLTAVFISMLVYMAYMFYLQQKYPDFGKPPIAVQNTAPISGTQPAPTDHADKTSTEAEEPNQLAGTNWSADEEAAPSLSASDAKIITTAAELSFDPKNGSIAAIELKKFRQFANKKDGNANVNVARNPIFLLPQINEALRPSKVYLNKDETGAILVTANYADGISALMRFSAADKDYLYDANLRVSNSGKSSLEIRSGLRMVSQFAEKSAASGGFFSFIPDASRLHFHSIVGPKGEKRVAENLFDFCEDAERRKAQTGQNSSLDFIGIDDHYFVKLVLPKETGYDYSIEKEASVNERCNPAVVITQPMGQLGPGNTLEQKFQIYFGPKELDRLQEIGAAEVVDYGWFSVIGKPLLYAIRFLHNVSGHNYGIAIILLTLLLKILFYPLTRSAAISMKKMQILTPEINRIKERFKDDKTAQQTEIMKFMGKHKINPAKGCLPILPQIPVFIAFYNVLSQSIELRHAPFFGWIQDLAAADPYYITPVLLGLGMVVQQKLTPNPTMDKTQEQVMLIVPVIFSFMMLTLPAGLVLYMITNTLITILQQQWLNKVLDKHVSLNPI